MRVFVTGASGWIGSAVVAELLSAGHQVSGLARSEESARAVTEAGADVVRGDVENLDALRAAAAESEGVVHLAFRHDIAFSGDFPTAVRSDRAVIEALGDVLADSGRPLLIASGLAGLVAGRPVTEADRGPSAASADRSGNELTALGLSRRGVRAVAVRFAPTVHGAGDHGFTAILVDAARQHGHAAYVGEGRNRWAAVHRSDAARLVRLGLEQAPADTVLHAVGEEGVELSRIAESIGRGLDLPAVSVSGDQAAAELGFLATFAATDLPASSTATQELLDWTPAGPTLIADLEAGSYF